MEKKPYPTFINLFIHRVHVAFDSNSQELIADFHYDDDKAAQSRWAHYVDKALPRMLFVACMIDFVAY